MKDVLIVIRTGTELRKERSIMAELASSSSTTYRIQTSVGSIVQLTTATDSSISRSRSPKKVINTNWNTTGYTGTLYTQVCSLQVCFVTGMLYLYTGMLCSRAWGAIVYSWLDKIFFIDSKHWVFVSMVIYRVYYCLLCLHFLIDLKFQMYNWKWFGSLRSLHKWTILL